MNILARSICTAAVLLAAASPAAAETTIIVSGRLLALSGFDPNVYDLSNTVSARFVYDEESPDESTPVENGFYYSLNRGLTSFSISVGDQLWEEIGEGLGLGIAIGGGGELKAIDALVVNGNGQAYIGGGFGALVLGPILDEDEDEDVNFGPLDFLVGDEESFFAFLEEDDGDCGECTRVATFSTTSVPQQFPGMALGTFGSVVPEPASWALMIAGFGLVGSALRRRRAAIA